MYLVNLFLDKLIKWTRTKQRQALYTRGLKHIEEPNLRHSFAADMGHVRMCIFSLAWPDRRREARNLTCFFVTKPKIYFKPVQGRFKTLTCTSSEKVNNKHGLFMNPFQTSSIPVWHYILSFVGLLQREHLEESLLFQTLK